MGESRAAVPGVRSFHTSGDIHRAIDESVVYRRADMEDHFNKGTVGIVLNRQQPETPKSDQLESLSLPASRSGASKNLTDVAPSAPCGAGNRKVNSCRSR